MKNSIILFYLLLGWTCLFSPCSAQVSISNTEILDTIYANDQKNIALFFSNPIQQGITGSEKFVFTYNRETQQHFGLLQATAGKESNLLIIDSKGSIFSYILKYKKALHKLNYFISDSSSIGNLNVIPQKEIVNNRILDSIESNKTKYQKFCKFLIQQKHRKPLVRKKRFGIRLSVNNIVFDENELYVIMEINNTSGLDYDVNFLKSFVQTKRKAKNISKQRILQHPIFKYKYSEKIISKKSNKFILVFNKFSLGKNKNFIFELNEKNGERNFKLVVKPKFTNNPN